jgi:hypothetical protein
MIIFFLTLINIFVLYTGIYIAVKNISTIDFNPLLRLMAVVLLLTIIGFLYYLTLTLNQDFFRLLIFLTVANCVFVSLFYKSFINAVKITKLKETSKNDIWVLFAVLIFTLFFFFSASKYGGWDAITQWNLKAKFLYFPHLWKTQFFANTTYLNRDYPLMLPSIIAFFWSSVHSVTPFIPMLFTLVVMIVTALLVYYSLLNEGQNLLAYISLIIFIASSNFREVSISQEADSLLSLFILLTIVLYRNLKSTSDNQVYILSFICASTAWVKNEGIVFCLLFTIGFFIVNYKNISALKKYIIGMAIPVLILASFKLHYPPPNVIFNHNDQHILTRLTNVNTIITICKAGNELIFKNYLLIVFLAITIIVFVPKFFKGLELPYLVLVSLSVSYFIVYLITPYEINWLIRTSMARLMQHGFPAMIYLLLLSLSSVKINSNGELGPVFK